MEEKLKLEAEIGRLFLEIEKSKAFQAQAYQKINELLKKVEAIKE